MGGSVTWEGHGSGAWQRILDVPAVHLYETIGSTNDVARELVATGAAPLTVVVADHQTKGRGRAGRSWLSAPGSSLLCTVILRAHADSAAPGAAPIRVGNAVAQAIAEVAHINARVKWPNDVVIPGFGKVAGVLCEAITRQGSAFVVAGIGVNVSAPGEGYASLQGASGAEIARGDLLRVIMNALRPYSENVTLPLGAEELARIRERDVLLDQHVVDDTGLAGVASGIAADGSLLVRTEAGVTAVHNATIRIAGSHDYPGARV